jgi:hypothetical protein
MPSRNSKYEKATRELIGRLRAGNPKVERDSRPERDVNWVAFEPDEEAEFLN